MNFLFDYFNSLFFSSKFLLIFLYEFAHEGAAEAAPYNYLSDIQRSDQLFDSLFFLFRRSRRPKSKGKARWRTAPSSSFESFNHRFLSPFAHHHRGRKRASRLLPTFISSASSISETISSRIDCRMRSFAPPYAASCLAFDLVVFAIGPPRCQRRAETREGVVGDWSSPLLLTRDRTSPPNRCIRASVFFLSVFVAFIHSSLYPIKTKETGQFKP